MKKNYLIMSLVLAFAFAISSCNPSAKKAVKTVENLKAAIKGETTASKKYEAFSAKAKEEGFMQVAVLFDAASKAEAIHAKNHTEVLTKLGVKMDDFTPEFKVNSTKENLDESIKGESHEFETMYPGFIKDAKEEGVEDAVKSFTWANDTEKKHAEFYKNALNMLLGNNIAALPSEYFVCPKCGNTFDAASVKSNCDFCQTAKEKFIQVKA